ncbi:MAG: heme-binding protein [Planctomycetes bacterium]|nr:heme-binding protein [Planctomycetota bacterium]
MTDAPHGLLREGPPRLTVEGAQCILQAAIAKAREVGVDMDIAVVDDGGHLVAFARMDGAKITSIDIAINKAFTSACTRLPTHAYTAAGGAGGPAFGIHASNGGRFTIFGGGVPILLKGACLGAVGCSSGTPEQDRSVAEAGIQMLLGALA